MNQSNDRNKSMADYRQNQTSARTGLSFGRIPLLLSILTGLSIGFFIGAAVVVLIRVMNSETDGMNAFVQAMTVFVPLIVLTVIARIIHKKSKSKGRVAKSLVMFCAVLGLAAGGALWVTAPTQHGLAVKMLDDNKELIAGKAEQLAACRAQIDNYPVGSLKEAITAEQLAELKKVQMNLKRSQFRLGEGWNTMLATDTDFARFKPGVTPDNVMDNSDRPKSSFSSPITNSYNRGFNGDVERLAVMAYGEPYMSPYRLRKFIEETLPMRYLVIIRMGEVNPSILTGKKYISGYVSGEAFCFDLAKKHLIAAFSFDATNSTKVEYTYKENSSVTAEANAAGNSLQEDLLKNSWPAFWNRFHSLASASVSSNQALKLPFKQVALDEARLNVVRAKISEMKRVQKVKEGMAAIKAGASELSEQRGLGIKLPPKVNDSVILTAEQKAEIRKLFSEQGKISAIRKYREFLPGRSLKDAKNAVEALAGN